MTGVSDWTGGVGDVWAREWRRTDRSFAGLSPQLNAAILAADRADDPGVVDIGCGAGGTSLALAAALGSGSITGIDLSPSLIAIARSRAGDQVWEGSGEAGGATVEFLCADVIEGVAGCTPVDLYCSRHGVMFFADPVAAFSALQAAATPGAALVFSCFADRAANRWAIEPVIGGKTPAPPSTAPGPFAFADPAHVAAILAQAGWSAEPPRRVDFAYQAGGGPDAVADAVDYLGRIGPAASVLRAAAPDDRDRAIAHLTQACAARFDGEGVAFPASAWIWTAYNRSEFQGSQP